MIATILAWIYIFSVSYCWGIIWLKLLGYHTKSGDRVHPVFLCLSGLAIIGAVCSILSLLIPLNNWKLHLLVISPCILVIQAFLSDVKKRIKFAYPAILKLLFMTAVIIVLLMASWVIEHPDTIGYQIQIIKWIEEFGLVPGIANLNTAFGYQNSWFCLEAFFGLQFSPIGHYIYLNSFVTILVIYFVCENINENFYKKNPKNIVLWVCFLTLSFLSYTQIRLTASSTSSDYIVTVYILSVFYLLYHELQKTKLNGSLIILFSVFAICVKLSAVPIFLIALYAIYIQIKEKNYRQLLLSTTICLLLAGAFLTRNAVTSGYMLYPSNVPDLISPSWKLENTMVSHISDYINSYAKIQDIYVANKLEMVKKMTLSEWLPVWWSQKSLVDKVILIFLIGSSVTSSFRLFFKQSETHMIYTITCLSGLIFWFTKAPDPRFGFGFILALISIEMVKHLKKIRLGFSSLYVNGILLVPCIIFSTYIVYRCINYASVQQVLLPLGIPKTTYQKVECNGIEVNIASYGSCGEASPPCVEGSCDKVKPIGTKVSDGFK